MRLMTTRRKDNTVDLPSLSHKLIKKISIEDKTCDVRKSSDECSLAVILEENSPVKKNTTFLKVKIPTSWGLSPL